MNEMIHIYTSCMPAYDYLVEVDQIGSDYDFFIGCLVALYYLPQLILFIFSRVIAVEYNLKINKTDF